MNRDYESLKLIHSIGSVDHPNYVELDEIIEADGPLSFDGIYESVYENREHLAGREITLFVMGSYVGKDNSFDKGVPLQKFCTWNQIFELSMGLEAEIAWHTWSHRDLTTLSYEELEMEIQPPFPMRYFAYPYGRFNDKVIEVVKAFGFEGAYSVYQGDNSTYQRNREVL